jgi:hypothetical protein
MPKVLGIIGFVTHAHDLVVALARFEPIGWVDMDQPIHDAIEDLYCLPGEERPWSDEGFANEVHAYRNFVISRTNGVFFVDRVKREIDSAEDSHSLYVVPNIRTLEEHRAFRALYRSYEYMAIHIRDESWLPLDDDLWAADPQNHVLQFEVGEAKPALLDQLLATLDSGE